MERLTIERSLSKSGVDKRNTTVYIRLGHDMGQDESIRYRFFVLHDGKIQTGPKSKEEGEDLIDCLIASPPRASLRSTMAVVGEQFYLVGGRLNADIDSDVQCYDFPCYNDVYRINPAVEKEWKECNSLNTPRSSAQLFVDSEKMKIYAFGNMIQQEKFVYTRNPHEPWAEVFDVEDNKWSNLEITPAPNSKCKNLPIIVSWCVHIPNSTRLLFFGIDNDDQEYDYFKLYVCDLSTKECDYFDETFASDLVCLSNGDWIIPVRDPPAQQGRFLYFPGKFDIYCYCLETRKWCSKPMGGFDLRSVDHDPTCLKMVSLGNQIFGALWAYHESRILSWTKFQVLNPPESGADFPRAIGFSASAAKKFRHPLSVDEDIDNMRCFVIAHSEEIMARS